MSRPVGPLALTRADQLGERILVEASRIVSAVEVRDGPAGERAFLCCQVNLDNGTYFHVREDLDHVLDRWEGMIRR